MSSPPGSYLANYYLHTRETPLRLVALKSPIMDVVLEVTDTFITDYVYAFLLPKYPPPYDFPATSSNSSDSSAQLFSSWTYKPATKYLYIEPSQAAYMSAWDRDLPLRQAITLYLITWCVFPDPGDGVLDNHQLKKTTQLTL